MNRKTLLYVSRDSFPTERPDIRDLFGIYMRRQGIDTVLVARKKPDGQSRKEDWPGGDVLLPSTTSANFFTKHVGSLIHDVRCVLANAGRCHVVQVRNKIASGFLCMLAARRHGKPFCYWLSFPFPEDDLLRARMSGLRLGALRWAATIARGLITSWLLYRVVLPRCDHVFAQSQVMKDDLLRRGIAREKITIAPMCVDMDATASVQPADLDGIFPPGSRVILHLGALNRIRRPDFLLRVLELVRRELPGAVLLMVGDAIYPQDRVWLKERIRSMGLDEAVRVTGWLPRRKAWQMAAASEVGVCALPPGYVTESMSPTKAVELLALGLPIVVTDQPDQGELVQASGGGEVTPYDERAMAEAVTRLLGDPEGAREMARKGREHVRANRSYEVEAPRLARVYEDVLARGGRS